MPRPSALVLLLSLILSARAAEPPVQLLLPSPTLSAESTFELLFATVMVGAEQIGQPAAVSPLVAEPAIPGRFVWLSARRGTFAPDQPLPLGTTYKFSLRPGTKNAAGQSIPDLLGQTAATPPFRLKGSAPIGELTRDNATAVPRFLLLFNADVRADAAAKFCRFVNDAGLVVPARVEQADDPQNNDRVFPPWQSDDGTLLNWGEKPPEPSSLASGDNSETSSSGDASQKAPPARGNVLYLAPTKPLPPGPGWRLVLDAGLPTEDARLRLPSKKEIEIGTVQPFRVSSLRAESSRIAGRRLVLEFNKALPEGMDGEELARWLTLTPVPPGLKVSVQFAVVNLEGDFDLGTRYRLALKPGLPAREPTTLRAPFSQETAFEPMAPRLYFQDFATHQWSGGTRQLRLLALNIPRVRVSARLFVGDAIPAATKAFDQYQEQLPEEPDEAYSRVDPELLAGKTIWEKELSSAGTVDAEQTVLAFLGRNPRLQPNGHRPAYRRVA